MGDNTDFRDSRLRRELNKFDLRVRGAKKKEESDLEASIKGHLDDAERERASSKEGSAIRFAIASGKATEAQKRLDRWQSEQTVLAQGALLQGVRISTGTNIAQTEIGGLAAMYNRSAEVRTLAGSTSQYRLEEQYRAGRNMVESIDVKTRTNLEGGRYNKVTPQDITELDTTERERSRYLRVTAKAKAALAMQRRMGQDESSITEDTENALGRHSKFKGRSNIAKGVAEGAYGGYGKALKDYDQAAASAAQALKAFDAGCRTNTKEMEELSGALQGAKAKLKEQAQIVAEMNRQGKGGPGSSGMTTSQAIAMGARAVGAIGQGLVAGSVAYRYANVTSEIQREQIRGGVAGLVNEQYSDMQAAASGDMRAMARISSGMYEQSFTRGQELRDAEKVAMGLEVSGKGAATLGNTVVAGAQGVAAGMLVGGPGGALAGGLIAGGSAAAEGGANTFMSAVDIAKGISASGAELQATQVFRAKMAAMTAIQGEQMETGKNYMSRLATGLRGLGVGGYASSTEGALGGFAGRSWGGGGGGGPIEGNYTVTQEFGGAHNGIDLSGPDRQLVAPISGTITTNRTARGGNQLFITGDDGTKIGMSHLASYDVTSGRVEQGQHVGIMGNSGHVIARPGGDGTHLHMTVTKDGKSVNPRAYLGGRSEGVEANGKKELADSAIHTSAPASTPDTTDHSWDNPYKASSLWHGIAVGGMMRGIYAGGLVTQHAWAATKDFLGKTEEEAAVAALPASLATRHVSDSRSPAGSTVATSNASPGAARGGGSRTAGGGSSPSAVGAAYSDSGGGDVHDRAVSWAWANSAAVFEGTGADSEQQGRLYGQAIGALGRDSLKAVGGMPEFARAARSAMQYSNSGILQSPDQYMGMLNQVTGGGGGTKDLDKVMAEAVAAGMDSSKNIEQMVGATTALAQASAQMGVSGIAGASTMMAAGTQGALAGGTNVNIAAQAAMGAVDFLNKGTSGRGGLSAATMYSLQTGSKMGLSTLDAMALSSTDISQVQNIKSLERAGKRDEAIAAAKASNLDFLYNGRNLAGAKGGGTMLDASLRERASTALVATGEWQTDPASFARNQALIAAGHGDQVKLGRATRILQTNIRGISSDSTSAVIAAAASGGDAAAAAADAKAKEIEARNNKTTGAGRTPADVAEGGAKAERAAAKEGLKLINEELNGLKTAIHQASLAFAGVTPIAGKAAHAAGEGMSMGDLNSSVAGFRAALDSFKSITVNVVVDGKKTSSHVVTAPANPPPAPPTPPAQEGKVPAGTAANKIPMKAPPPPTGK